MSTTRTERGTNKRPSYEEVIAFFKDYGGEEVKVGATTNRQAWRTVGGTKRPCVWVRLIWTGTGKDIPAQVWFENGRDGAIMADW